MNNWILRLLVSAFASFMTTTAIAESEREFVGWSDDTVDGEVAGVLDYDLVCKATFGPNAKWATTVDVLDNPVAISNSTAGFAWVRPVIVGFVANSQSSLIDTVDASGVSKRTALAGLGCHIIGGENGVVILPNGKFALRSCQNELTPPLQVACSTESKKKK